jgi:hypothetical protein
LVETLSDAYEGGTTAVRRHDPVEAISTLQLPWAPPPSLYRFKVEDAQAQNDIGRWVLYLLLRIKDGPYDGHRLKVRILNRDPEFDEETARAEAERLADTTFSGHIADRTPVALSLPSDLLAEAS